MANISTGALLLFFSLAVIGLASGGRDLPGDFLRLPSEALNFFRGGASDASDEDSVGTRWAVLIAGSNGYWNYRHQVIFVTLISFINLDCFSFFESTNLCCVLCLFRCWHLLLIGVFFFLFHTFFSPNVHCAISVADPCLIFVFFNNFFDF